MRKSAKLFIVAVALATLWLPGKAQALYIDDFTTVDENTTPVLFFTFSVIGTPNSTLADLGLLDFGLAMSEDNGQLIFEFVNVSSTASVIAQIYLDDSDLGLFANGSVLDSSAGVDFAVGSPTPPNLPSGNSLSPKFDTNGALSAFANNPAPSNGISELPEYLVLAYDYAGGSDFQDVYDAFFTGDLRIGMHVISIGTLGQSDAFIATPTDVPPPPRPLDPVPEPATVALLGMGSCFLVARMKFAAR